MHMKRCNTCGCLLWVAWLLTVWPWSLREKQFSKAEDCIDLLPRRVTDKIRREVKIEMGKLDAQEGVQ